MTDRGKFIAIDGIDGAGKTTHKNYVLTYLANAGKQVVSTREPGGTPLGEKLRVLLLKEKMHLETEALLMFASRRQHIAEIIEPTLARGDWVLTDRFTEASFAYQGGGRGLDLVKLEQLERWVQADLQPDLTLLFDVPPDVARKRMSSGRTLDRFEQEQDAFFARCRQEYLRRAEQFSDRIVVIDASKSVADTQASVCSALRRML